MIEKPNTDKLYPRDPGRHLCQLGWRAHFRKQVQHLANKDLRPGRVIGAGKNSFRVSDGEQEWLATAAGRLRHHVSDRYPVTGDWVLLTDTVICEVLVRQNALSRGAAGTRGKQAGLAHKEQVIAANLDAVFIVCGLDRDFNLRRIERYITLVYNCGLNPVIVLTKADLHQNPEPFASEVASVAFGIPTHLVSALDCAGLVDIEKHLAPGKTIALVGSSGAGKSTLINRLCGETVQAIGSISSSVGKGTHTTTTRDLIRMPQGGMVIDNPGIREIALWHDADGIEAAFPEIESLSGGCRFSDCSHLHEPGCRVLQAVAGGELPQARLDSYHKMKRELAYLADRQHKSSERVEKERWKEVAMKIKALNSSKRKGRYAK